MRGTVVALGALIAGLGGASSALACSVLPPGVGEVKNLDVQATAAGSALATWDRYGKERNRVGVRSVALGPDGAWTWADPADAPAADAAPGVMSPLGASAVVGIGTGGHAVALLRVEAAATPENLGVRRRTIRAADRSPDGTWRPEYTLAGPDAPKMLEPIICAAETYGGPAVAVDGAGNAVAAWVERDPEPAGKVLKWAARPAGGAWSAPTVVAPAGEQVGLTVDASGTALMTWISGGRLLAAIRPAGGTFGTAEDLGPAIASRLALGEFRPSVTFGANGRALAVWAADRRILAATRAPGGGWTTPVDLSRIAENPPPLISEVRLSRKRLRAGATALTFRLRAAGEVVVTLRRKGRGPVVRGVRLRAARGLNRIVLLRRPLRPGAYSVRIGVRSENWAPASRTTRVVVLPRT